MSAIYEKFKIELWVVIAGVAIFFWNDYRDAKAAERMQTMLVSTLEASQKPIGDALQAQNRLLKDERAADRAILEKFGQSTSDALKQNGYQLAALASAIGSIRSSTGTSQPTNTSTDLKGNQTATFIQDRGSNPPLSDVYVSFNPATKQYEPAKWNNFGETFKLNVGEFKDTKDNNGLRYVFSLDREVVDNKGVSRGKEKIQLGEAVVQIPESTIRTLSNANSLAIPRWTLNLGLGYDPNADPLTGKKYSPALALDYRVTNKFGVWLGTANYAATAGLSYRFNFKP